MGKNDVLEILRKFRRALEDKEIHVDKLVLFGSWAKGTQHEGSDIDVVVISRDFEGKDPWSRIKLMGSAIYKVFAPIQAAAVTPKEWAARELMVCQLAKDGDVLAV
jgi:predicted nucleotidyltransferase